MSIPVALKLLRRSKLTRVTAKPELFQDKRLSVQGNGGFTLIEFLVVVIIIAILSAIAAPGWLGFVSQRRVNAANETILRSVQQAQSEAKKNKQSYSISLVAPSGEVPKIAVYQGDQGSEPPANDSPLWKSLGEGIKPGQIWLGTNASNNTAGNNLDPAPPTYPTTPTITFDYMGTVPPTAARSIIVVAVPAPDNPSNPLPQTRRCVEVTTLLGAIQGGRPVEVTGGTSGLQCLPR
jgi:prepilin-type N-terminal cleavage/methylation domain-containing protein